MACKQGTHPVSSPLSESFAAVDLGSNSFHMVVARFEEGRIQIIDRIKDMVRIASGLDAENNLTEEAMQRALQCLERFAQRIAEIPKSNVKAVGTNTLRQARNGGEFIHRAQGALGHNIDVISGREEARLVFLGVAQTVYNDSEKRLVIDIGGGSTELIIGRGFKPSAAESLYMGCVNVSRRFFADGTISEKRMRAAVLFARTELEAIEANYRRLGWEIALGSSGTIRTISEVTIAQGWHDTGISRAALEMLSQHLIAAGHYERLHLKALSDRRRSVFAGGVAILTAVFQALELAHIQVSEGALREGIVYELVGRYRNEDIRNATVADMAARYGVDQEQAEKVAAMALALYKQTKKSWRFDQADKDRLRWAAQLHEIGLAIAHAQYHRHGAYLLSHSDMPGFSRREQHDLALLVGAQRRKFPLLAFDQTMPNDRQRMVRLAILLRLSCLMCRSRSYGAPPKIKATAEANSLSLTCERGWLEEHPLTKADLQAEGDYLKAIPFQLHCD